MTEVQKQAVVSTLLRRGTGLANKGFSAAQRAVEPLMQSKAYRLTTGTMGAHKRITTGKQKGEEVADVLRKAQRTAAPPSGVRDVSAGGGMTALAALQMMKESAAEGTGVGGGLLRDESFRKGLLGAAGVMATTIGAGLLGIGATHVARGVGGMFERSQRNKLFQEIARRDPQIARDPRAREYFDLVMTYAPSLGRHPTAIRDFLKKQLMYPVSSTEFLHALANFESTVKQNLEKGTARQVGLAFERGATGAVGTAFGGK